MSLLHEALKKAEANPLDMGGRAFVDQEEPIRSRTGRTPWIVAGFALVALGAAAAWFRFGRNETAVMPPSPSLTSLAHPGGAPQSTELATEARVLLEAHRWSAAKERLEKIVTLEPRNAEAYSNLGLALKKLGHSNEATLQYRKAIALNPQCAPCVNNLGVLYLFQRNLEAAEAEFNQAIQISETYAAPYFHLGIIFEARGDRAKARVHFQRYIELAKEIDAEFLNKVQQRLAQLGP